MKRHYKTLYFFTILSIGIVSNSIAQPALTWEETNHDFGEVVEGDQAVHEFKFTNTGDQPLVLSNVQASCGCTTPFWTREPVMPGAEGVIKASYNSRGRPGNFRKSITVTSNADPARSAVYIQGVVVQRPPTAEEIAASAKVTVASNLLNVGKVEKGATVPVTITVTNDGVANLSLSNIRSNCSCIFFDPETSRNIPSGESAEVTLLYTPSATGERLEAITWYTNDVQNKEFTLTIQSEVVESLEEGMGGRRGF